MDGDISAPQWPVLTVQIGFELCRGSLVKHTHCVAGRRGCRRFICWSSVPNTDMEVMELFFWKFRKLIPMHLIFSSDAGSRYDGCNSEDVRQFCTDILDIQFERRTRNTPRWLWILQDQNYLYVYYKYPSTPNLWSMVCHFWVTGHFGTVWLNDSESSWTPSDQTYHKYVLLELTGPKFQTFSLYF